MPCLWPNSLNAAGERRPLARVSDDHRVENNSDMLPLHDPNRSIASPKTTYLPNIDNNETKSGLPETTVFGSGNHSD